MVRRRRGVRPYLRVVLAIIHKDLATEWRSREMVSTMVVFSLLVILIYNFALDLDAGLRASIASGIIWVTLAFAGTLGLSRSMAAERDLGCLDGLLLAPVDRTAIYFGKALSNWLFILLTAVIFLPLFGLLYNAFSVLRPGMLGIVLMGTFGYAAVGTLFSTMTIQTRTREILLPVLLLPVVLPLLFAAVRAGAGILQGSSWQDILPWFNLLLAYDLVLPAACFMAFEYVVEE